MIKRNIFIITILIAFIWINCSSINSQDKIINNNNLDNQNDILIKYGVKSSCIPRQGVVPDAKTARRIAELVFIRIYGKDINDKKPFRVKYDNKYGVWVVKGRLKKGMIGGVPNLIIQKSNAKVLAIWHTK